MAAAFCSALLAGAVAAPAPASAAPKATAPVTLSGTWGTAKPLPGLAALNKGGDGVIDSVSCASAGNCGAAGIYRDGIGRTQVFVANQTNGTWGKAIEVPGIQALNVGGVADFITLSCASPGNCSASGEYSVLRGGFHQGQGHRGPRHGGPQRRRAGRDRVAVVYFARPVQRWRLLSGWPRQAAGVRGERDLTRRAGAGARWPRIR
jgi:hypothetical protein